MAIPYVSIININQYIINSHTFCIYNKCKYIHNKMAAPYVSTLWLKKADPCNTLHNFSKNGPV